MTQPKPVSKGIETTFLVALLATSIARKKVGVKLVLLSEPCRHNPQEDHTKSLLQVRTAQRILLINWCTEHWQNFH